MKPGLHFECPKARAAVSQRKDIVTACAVSEVSGGHSIVNAVLKIPADKIP